MASIRNYQLQLAKATPIAVKGITTLFGMDDIRIAYNDTDLADGSADYATVFFNLQSNTNYTFDAGSVQTTLWVTTDTAGGTILSVNTKQGQQGD